MSVFSIVMTPYIENSCISIDLKQKSIDSISTADLKDLYKPKASVFNLKLIDFT